MTSGTAEVEPAGEDTSSPVAMGTAGVVPVGVVMAVGVTDAGGVVVGGDDGGVVVGGGVDCAPSEYLAMVTPVSMSERSW